MPTRRLLPAVLPLAFAVALGACGGDGGGGAAASQEPSDGDPAASAEGEAGAARPSPIEELMGWDATRPMELTEDEQQQMRDLEARIAACMRAEGFEYVPQDPSYDPTGMSEINALPPDEFAARYGYGISTIDLRAQSEQAQRDDPNDAIFDGLSQAARREYYAALNGAATAAEKFGEPPPANSDAQPGCRPQAERAVFGDLEKTPLPPDLDALSGEIDALWDTILADPRVADASSAWGECMAGAGHSELARPEDARFEVTRRLYQLHGLEPPTEAPPPERPGRRGGFEPAAPGPRGGQEPDPAALDELRRYEVAVAVADRGCRPAYEEVVAQVRDEVERAFIDQHRAELERYRDAIALASGEG